MSEGRTPELMYERYLVGPPWVETGAAGMIDTLGSVGSPTWLSVVRLLGEILARDVDADIASLAGS